MHSFFKKKILPLIVVVVAITRLQVEAGDVIVRVNGTDVHHFTTKEGTEATFPRKKSNKNQFVLAVFIFIKIVLLLFISSSPFAPLTIFANERFRSSSSSSFPCLFIDEAFL